MNPNNPDYYSEKNPNLSPFANFQQARQSLINRKRKQYYAIVDNPVGNGLIPAGHMNPEQLQEIEPDYAYKRDNNGNLYDSRQRHKRKLGEDYENNVPSLHLERKNKKFTAAERQADNEAEVERKRKLFDWYENEYPKIREETNRKNDRIGMLAEDTRRKEKRRLERKEEKRRTRQKWLEEFK